MKQLIKKLLIPSLLAVMVLTGCYTVTQEGNKIYTDAPYDLTYEIAKQTLKDRGYTVKEENKNASGQDGYIVGVSTAQTKLNQFKDPAGEIRLEIKAKPADAEKGLPNHTEVKIIVTVKKNDQPPEIKEDQAKVIAKTAVDDIKSELDKYAKFDISQKNQIGIRYATDQKVHEFLKSRLQSRGYQVSANDSNSSISAQKETPSPFNDPLNVQTKVQNSDQEALVSYQSSLKGNYDQNGSVDQVKQGLNDINAILGQYPIAAQTQPKEFMYLDLDQIVGFLKETATTLGYQEISAAHEGSGLTAQHPETGLILDVQVQNANDKQQPTYITGVLEGNSSDNRAQLDQKIQAELAKFIAELNNYQHYYTSSKLFSNISKETAIRYAKKVLKDLGYVNVQENEMGFVSAHINGLPTNKVVLTVEEIGSEGTTIDAYSFINKKYDNEQAKSINQRRVNAIMKALSKFDKENLK